MAISSSHKLMKCPKCLTPNNISRAKLGDKIRCEKCGSTITVRDSASTAVPAAEPSEPPPLLDEEPQQEERAKTDTRMRRRGGKVSGAMARAKARRAANVAREEEDEESDEPRAPRPEKKERPPNTDNTGALIGGLFLCAIIVGFLMYLVMHSGQEKKAKGAYGEEEKNFHLQGAGGDESSYKPPPTDPNKKTDWVPEVPGFDPAKGKKPDDGKKMAANVEGDSLKVDEALQTEIMGMLKTWEDASTARLVEIKDAIKAKGGPAIPVLIMAVGDESEWIGMGATEILKEMTGNNNALSPGMSVEDRRNIRSRWIRWWGANAQNFGAGPITEPPKEDTSGGLIDSVLCAVLAATSPAEMTRPLAELKKQGTDVIPLLIQKLTGSNKNVAAGAAVALQELTGKMAGDLPPGDVKPFADEWAEWWKSNKDSFKFK